MEKVSHSNTHLSHGGWTFWKPTFIFQVIEERISATAAGGASRELHAMGSAIVSKCVGKTCYY